MKDMIKPQAVGIFATFPVLLAPLNNQFHILTGLSSGIACTQSIVKCVPCSMPASLHLGSDWHNLIYRGNAHCYVIILFLDLFLLDYVCLIATDCYSHVCLHQHP